MPVLEPAERAFTDVQYTGLAIQETPNGYHSGILYKLPDSEARIVHLAFHHILRDEEAAAPFRWAQLGLDEDNKLILAVLASRIQGSGVLISYGFDSNGVVFDTETGELNEVPVGKGLTCATFIVAALRTFAHNLIDEADWPERADDEEWQAVILGMLEGRASEEHIEAVRRDVGAKRFRPTEVVGAATVDSDLWPVSFADARALADEVEADLAA